MESSLILLFVLLVLFLISTIITGIAAVKLHSTELGVLCGGFFIITLMILCWLGASITKMGVFIS